VCPAYAGQTQAVWQNGGFSAFLEANCLTEVQEFLVTLC